MTVESATSDPLPAAREALARHAWQEAYDLFKKADAEKELAPADLEALGDAAWFSARGDEQMELQERAHRAYLADGNKVRAAYLGLDLARGYFYKGKPSMASAWAGRAERILQNEPESYAHGYLAMIHAEKARAEHDIDTAMGHSQRAVDIGTRSGDADLLAHALMQLGSLKIAIGAAAEGFALMEEATVAAVNGELSPMAAGATYCQMISACRDLTDYQRASEWTEATERWCERQSVGGFPGVCRIHRAEVVALSGAWERAESELRRATEELASYNATPPRADGFYALGELRLRMGNLTGAEEALREAHGLGRSPQPALALIRLAEGKVRFAEAAIDRAVQEETWDKLARARLLHAQVEIAIAAHDVPKAHKAAEELDLALAAYDSPALRASRNEAWGRVHLAEGDFEEAARRLHEALRDWRIVPAPYETARSRVLLSHALRELHDVETANLELQAARDEFERLGARLDAEATDRAQRAAAEREAPPEQARRTFMITDIVGSTNLAEALGNDAWANLLQWHDDMLRACFARNGADGVNSTGDGFFAAFASARQGVECAMAIQRLLAEHRRTAGFAPSVRIGLHSGEANKRGEAYSGMAVHIAARVAALAGGGEIFATADVLADAGEVAASPPHDVSVKGVTAPVSVASVSWS